MNNPLATFPTYVKRRVFENEFGTIDKEYFFNGVSLSQYYWVYNEPLHQFTVARTFEQALFMVLPMLPVRHFIDRFMKASEQFAKQLALVFQQATDSIKKTAQSIKVLSESVDPVEIDDFMTQDEVDLHHFRMMAETFGMTTEEIDQSYKNMISLNQKY